MKLNLPRPYDQPQEPAMTTTAQETVQTQNLPVEKPAVDPKVKKRNDKFRSNVELTKQYRRKLIQNWNVNKDYRMGKPFATQSDDDQIAVPIDWSMTKTKQATLFSQIPRIMLSHHPESAGAGPWLAKYEGAINDTLVAGGLESALDECLPDCINAAGIGVVLVSYEALTVDKEVPSIDLSIFPPEMQAEIMKTGSLGGEPIPMETVPQTVDKRFLVTRISPSDFLWPLSFTSSNYDNSPWVGRSGRISWATCLQRKWAKPEEKEQIVGEERQSLDRMINDVDREKLEPEENVEFDELFYKVHAFDEDAKSYSAIHHLVFIHGKTDPVVDEPWQGQKEDEQGGIIGSLKYPLRVLTLAYISDEAIPPSDSAIGRPQVNEINLSRSQVIMQRKRNLPVRWADINRVDPAIMQALMKGTWQNFIPVQGDGSRIIGETAKSGHPIESPTFDQVAKNDLAEAWSIGPNQQGSGSGVETKGEANQIANSFQTRVGRERARVGNLIVGIAEVVGGLLALYEDPQRFGEGFTPAFSKSLSFSILADSTVLVEAKQKLAQMNEFVNTYAKSGFIALEPVLREIAILTGLDPNTVIKAPDPQQPPPPNISLRLSGAEDMMNPLMLAFMLESGQGPKPESIEMAKNLIQSAVLNPAMFPPQPPPPLGGPGAPPMGPDGQPVGPPEKVGDANPEATILPTIKKRSDDPSGTGGPV